MKITLTAYCPCKKCCGREGGLTASGTVPHEGRTIAAPRRYRHLLGREVIIELCNETHGRRLIVEDLAARWTPSWDLFMTSHGRATKFGKQNATLIVL